MELALPAAFGFLLVLLRTGALVAAGPVLGARTIPGRIKLGLTLVVAWVAFTAAGTGYVTASEQSAQSLHFATCK